MIKDRLGSIPVETRSGCYVVKNENGDCLLKSIDPFGMDRPEFCHPDFAGRFTKNQARDQVNFCFWSGNKVRTSIARVFR